MRPFSTPLRVLALAAGLASAASSSAFAQAAGGPGTAATTPGICSGGGCIPRTPCQDQTSLCSAFPDHPAYDPNVEFRKGADAMKAGDYKEAQRRFDKVVYLAPTNGDALFALGMADVGLGDLAGGKQAFERALKWNPKQTNAARELALADLKLGQTDKADMQLTALKARAAKCAGRCSEAGDLKDAIEAIETAAARGRRS